MYATVRLYRLNPIFEQEFVRVWQRIRQKLIDEKYIEYAVLHRESKISYLSYIHWQSQEVFENYIKSIPEEFQDDLQKIDECCNNNVILHRMTVLGNNSELVVRSENKMTNHTSSSLYFHLKTTGSSFIISIP